MANANIEAIRAEIATVKNLRTKVSEAFSMLSNVYSELESRAGALNALVNAVDKQLATAEGAQTAPLVDRVNAMLSGEFKKRTMQAVIDATGATREQILAALETKRISIVIKHRREDGAELIGLASRNCPRR